MLRERRVHLPRSRGKKVDPFFSEREYIVHFFIQGWRERTVFHSQPVQYVP